jgi:hypothetical protein
MFFSGRYGVFLCATGHRTVDRSMSHQEILTETEQWNEMEGTFHRQLTRLSDV